MMLGRLLRTLVRLRPEQVVFRLVYQLPRRHIKASDLAAETAERSGVWQAGFCAAASVLGPRHFRFLNEECRFGERVEWTPPGRSVLWCYNLHYFDALCAPTAEVMREVHEAHIDQWLEDCPQGHPIAWDPYPTSLRIVNWIKWDARTGSLSEKARESLKVQAEWLYRRPERHILGNHLFENAKALVLAGLYFSGPSAKRWLDRGTRLLIQQIEAQIGDDGGHAELSPMYHAVVTLGVLDLVQADQLWTGRLNASVVIRLRSLVGPMLGWLDLMSHPDGAPAFFNDSAEGIAPTVYALGEFAKSLGFSPKLRGTNSVDATDVAELKASGFVVVRSRSVHAMLDVGEAGFAQQPGHAHADTLSFELSVGGRRFLVNSGTSVYGVGALRAEQRSTPAHNTLSIDGLNSSEVWAGFRLGRRARIIARSVAQTEKSVFVVAAHDGYRHLIGRPVHQRTWRFSEHGLLVHDHVATAQDLPRETHWHIHPDWHCEGYDETTVRFSLSAATATLQFDNARLTMEETSWYPEFGRAVPNLSLRARLSGDAVCRISWIGGGK